jgi:hypothetical protein
MHQVAVLNCQSESLTSNSVHEDIERFGDDIRILSNKPSRLVYNDFKYSISAALSGSLRLRFKGSL